MKTRLVLSFVGCALIAGMANGVEAPSFEITSGAIKISAHDRTTEGQPLDVIRGETMQYIKATAL